MAKTGVFSKIELMGFAKEMAWHCRASGEASAHAVRSVGSSSWVCGTSGLKPAEN